MIECSDNWFLLGIRLEHTHCREMLLCKRRQRGHLALHQVKGFFKDVAEPHLRDNRHGQKSEDKRCQHQTCTAHQYTADDHQHQRMEHHLKASTKKAPDIDEVD